MSEELEKQTSNDFNLDTEFESIIPWNGEHDTGYDVLMKWDRNFQRVKTAFSVVLDYISENLSDLDEKFLHKDQEDLTNFLLKLLGGIVTDNIQSQNFVAGALGTGHLIKTDPDTGKSYAEIDELFVRLKAVFAALEIMELTYSGGNYIFGARCTRVEEFETYFRCYFTADDGSKKVKNKFRVDDFVQCREFNIEEGVHENVSNKYYWRRCVSIGEDYIDLSKADRDMTSEDSPAEGDNLVTIGNKTDTSRQNVIIISVYGEGSPSFIQYSGIDTYSLEGKAKTIISPSRNEFRGTFLFESGDDVKGYVDGEFASVRSDVAQLKIKDQEIVLSVSSAQSAAEAAKGTATNALNTAKAAQESIAQIKVQVDNISLTVSTVEKKADDAQSAADSANSAISTVKTDVASLQLQVGNISLTVSSVEDKADAAQSTASSAASTASSAYNTAQSANSTASSAASTASSALSTASSALDKAENAQDNASSAISQVSSLQVQVGSITSTVSRLENGNELVSIINQTATSITIDARKINLYGFTSINEGFRINTDGSFDTIRGTLGKMTLQVRTSDDGLYYIDDSKNSEMSLRPNSISAVPYNVFELNPSSSQYNLLLYLKRRRGNSLDRALYVEGVAEVYGRLGVGRGNNNGFDAFYPALVTEGMSCYGQFCLPTRSITTSSVIDYSSSYIVLNFSSSGGYVYLPSTHLTDGQTIIIRNIGSTMVKVYGNMKVETNSIISSYEFQPTGRLHIHTYYASRGYWIVNNLN